MSSVPFAVYVTTYTCILNSLLSNIAPLLVLKHFIVTTALVSENTMPATKRCLVTSNLATEYGNMLRKEKKPNLERIIKMIDGGNASLAFPICSNKL